MDEALSSYLARRTAVLERIRTMLVSGLDLRRGRDEIDPDVSLFGTGLGLDSVDAVEIVVALEMEFGVKLQDPVRRKLALRSVNALVDAVLANEVAHG